MRFLAGTKIMSSGIEKIREIKSKKYSNDNAIITLGFEDAFASSKLKKSKHKIYVTTLVRAHRRGSGDPRQPVVIELLDHVLDDYLQIL